MNFILLRVLVAISSRIQRLRKRVLIIALDIDGSTVVGDVTVSFTFNPKEGSASSLPYGKCHHTVTILPPYGDMFGD